MLTESAAGGTAAVATTGIDEQAKLPYWQLANKYMSLRLVQRLPDQSRGFFQARAFSKEHAERIAQSCVFQTVFKNLSNQSDPSPLEYNMREWVVYSKGRERGMKTREDWATEWQEAQVAQPSRIAFEWAMMPTRQAYEPGDYNWGMSMFNLKPDTPFDVKVVWQQHGKTHNAMIKGIRCAPDIHPDPEEYQ
ncbi:MAG: hypothetical protein JSW10_05170 [Pseudomonadota bacterium]|nr:MAG: hypothetical protein JSW10_05170 [Pseudomonadota bacterium]